MSDDIDTRRRRAAYRCGHRGTKEMDFMLGRYAAATLPALADPDLAHFERFIALQDPQLQGWLLSPNAVVDAVYADLVSDVRKFHGL